MMRGFTAIVAMAMAGVAIAAGAQTPAQGPTYTTDGKLEFPKDYRQWVYLSTGFDMSYLENAQRTQHTFGNVFVNPSAYEAFQKTGTWPDKTMLVLEVRQGANEGALLKGGQYQSGVLHTEVHLKDTARFEGGWGFFGFPGQAAATMIPRTATCYSCHAEHGVVDTTFVQFYPTLLTIARAKGTLR
jgi:Cytochrome P460